jgi:hypothetical protein
MIDNLGLPRTGFSLIMVMIMTTSVSIMIMLAGCGDDGQHTHEDKSMLFSDQLAASPQAQFPHAKEWLECRCDGTDFIFFQEAQPGYGVSVIDFHGWRRVVSKNAWERIVYARFGGLGSAKIHFNEASASCSLRGSANNKFNDKDVIVIDLRTAVR